MGSGFLSTLMANQWTADPNQGSTRTLLRFFSKDPTVVSPCPLELVVNFRLSSIKATQGFLGHFQYRAAHKSAWKKWNERHVVPKWAEFRCIITGLSIRYQNKTFIWEVRNVKLVKLKRTKKRLTGNRLEKVRKHWWLMRSNFRLCSPFGKNVYIFTCAKAIK